HKKFTLPIACWIFLFIGAPLGAIIRKGGLGMPIVVSVIFFIFFYVLMTQGNKLAREGVLYPWFGVWMPVFIMIPIALFLTYQSATDSALFDLSAWKQLFKPKKLD
ncbi:MAG: LptF/LptG family permease, partial [Bacteroidia bacterium]|nr:LptF/LptG family permease [Bacteroidia bacterium]